MLWKQLFSFYVFAGGRASQGSTRHLSAVGGHIRLPAGDLVSPLSLEVVVRFCCWEWSVACVWNELLCMRTAPASLFAFVGEHAICFAPGLFFAASLRR